MSAPGINNNLSCMSEWYKVRFMAGDGGVSIKLARYSDNYPCSLSNWPVEHCSLVVIWITSSYKVRRRREEQFSA